jgi:hypothetical protein
MTDTQLRFLRAIAERLPLERVAELYLFPPMRQGTLETGIAIVAAVLDDGAGEPRDALADAPPSMDATVDVPPALDAEACDPTDDASRDRFEAETHAGEDARSVESSVVDGADDAGEVAAAADATAVDGSEGDAPVAASRYVRADAEVPRHTVYTARYRLTLKGPERGKWELNVMEEADAPLLTVEMVVRGVQHRAGEGAEPERLEPQALRELLGAPAH